jgi:Ca2+-binding RTX toxin-like protein
MADQANTGHDHLDASSGGASHSPTEILTQASLSAALQKLGGADRVFFADLNELNNSDAEGGALLVLKGSQLTVITAATGVEAGQLHAQHIHGFEDGRNSNVPTLAQDTDRDGFIELGEGISTYGPILLNLTSPPGPAASGFPTPDGTSFLFSQTYDLNDPANGALATLLDDVSLDRREIVLHGLSTALGHGAGTTGEVDGSAGYKVVLPIAAGEIRELSSADALDSIQSALSLKLGPVLTGTAGVDQIFGGSANGTLLGLGGSDLLSGGGGNDYVNGGSGHDVLFGGSGNDYLDGASGNDSLNGQSGDDHLSGGSGNDVLSGGRGHDHIKGDAGNDTALFNVSRDGNDSVDLGIGSDLVNVSASGPGQVRLTFTSAEVGNGNAKDAGTLANQDGGLAVRLQAENGADVLTGPLSRFDDEGVTFVAGSAGLTFDVRDLVSGAARGDQFKVVTLGTSGADTLTAVQPAKAYYFNAGLGDDRVVGGLRNDFLVGGAGNDSLRGQDGNDTFIGGGGNDLLRGDAGNDTFIFNAPLNPATNVDTIRDFGRDDDRVQLDDAVFTGLTLGALSANAFALAATTAEADDRVIYDQATGNLFFDADGGARDNATLFANLANRAAFTANDVFVI